MKTGRPTKFKAHFNRINMQRGKPEVWTVHWRGACYQVERVVILRPCHTVFRPGARQPRAWFEGTAHDVALVDGVATVS